MILCLIGQSKMGCLGASVIVFCLRSIIVLVMEISPI